MGESINIGGVEIPRLTKVEETSLYLRFARQVFGATLAYSIAELEGCYSVYAGDDAQELLTNELALRIIGWRHEMEAAGIKGEEAVDLMMWRFCEWSGRVRGDGQ